MTVLPMLAVGFFMNFVAVLFAIVCIVLILVILIQKGRGGGLSAAFGGGMGGGVLGSKTGDFLTWVTIVLVGVFLLLAVILARFYRPSEARYGADVPTQQSEPARPAPTETQDMGVPGDVVPESGPIQGEPNASGG